MSSDNAVSPATFKHIQYKLINFKHYYMYLNFNTKFFVPLTPQWLKPCLSILGTVFNGAIKTVTMSVNCLLANHMWTQNTCGTHSPGSLLLVHKTMSPKQLLSKVTKEKTDIGTCFSRMLAQNWSQKENCACSRLIGMKTLQSVNTEKSHVDSLLYGPCRRRYICRRADATVRSPYILFCMLLFHMFHVCFTTLF